MNNFRDKPYKDRMAVRGTPAENAFVRYAKKKGWRGAKYGFEEGVEYFYNLPDVIRSTPDFVITHPDAMLVEVKGCGRDGIVKLKERDLKALEEWERACVVMFFFYDSHRQRVATYFLDDVLSIIDREDVQRGTYPENRAMYYMIPVDFMEWEDIE